MVTVIENAVFSGGFVAERVISEWITFYNTARTHTALDKRTPDEAYFDGKEMMKAA